MNAYQSASQRRIALEKYRKAKELVALADTLKIEIGWERIGGEEFTTFNPMDACPQKFIEEATILAPFIKQVLRNRNRV